MGDALPVRFYFCTGEGGRSVKHFDCVSECEDEGEMLKQKLQCSVVLQLRLRNHNRREDSEHNDVQAFQPAWMMTKHDGISLHEFALKLPVCLFQVWSGARDGGDRNMERNPICLEHSFKNPQKHWPE